MAAHTMTALSLIIDVPLAIVLIGIVRQLTAMQGARLADVPPSSTDPQPPNPDAV